MNKINLLPLCIRRQARKKQFEAFQRIKLHAVTSKNKGKGQIVLEKLKKTKACLAILNNLMDKK